MNVSPTQTPVEEYERQQAARCERAKRRVAICYAITCVPYVASWFVGLLWGESGLWPFLIASGLAWTCGLATGIVTLCHWPLLTWSNRAFGLAPWFYFTLMSLPFVMIVLR